MTLRERFASPSASITKVFLNNNGTSFAVPAVADLALSPGPARESTHDAFFLDTNADDSLDIILCNEQGPNQLYENKLLDLNVLTPLETAPAFAGTNAQGRKVLLRVHYDEDVPGLGPGSFVIIVDGTQLPSTDTVVASKIEGEY